MQCERGENFMAKPLALQYIQATLVKQTLQVVTAMKKCDDLSGINIPASLSTPDPKRQVMGVWITPVGRQVGQLLLQEAEERRLTRHQHEVATE